MAVIHMSIDSNTWELHPAGDELLYVLSGAIDVVLQEEGDERVVELRAGAVCIVPRGTWHRQKVRPPGDMLFITPGDKTQHRPL